MIEVFCHCLSRDQFIKGMSSTLLPVPGVKGGVPLMTVDRKTGEVRLLPGIEMAEVGIVPRYEDQEVEVDVQYDQPDGKPPIFVKRKELRRVLVSVVDGYHVNLRATGEIEKMLTEGLPQTDKDGNLLPLFQRTRLAALIPGLKLEPATAKKVPEGFVGLNGVRLYDPATVKNPALRFA